MKDGMFKRFVPISFFAVGTMVGAYLFQDYLSFDALKTHRVDLLESKQSNVILLNLGFAVFYAAIAAFSLPGATVLFIAVLWGVEILCCAAWTDSKAGLRKLLIGCEAMSDQYFYCSDWSQLYHFLL